MELVDIIKELDKAVRANGSNGHLLLSKQILPTSVNVYKEVTFTLWYKDFTDTKEVCKMSTKVKLPSNQKEKILNDLSLQFMGIIFCYMQTEGFKKVVYGRETGVEAE